MLVHMPADDDADRPPATAGSGAPAGAAVPAPGPAAEQRALMHQLNNHLGLIAGYAELAALQPGADPRLAAYLQGIQAGATMAAETVRRLQESARR